jgi:glycosyltransferase involved in cell wall biosynthesis
LPGKAEARRRLSLPLEQHIAIYNGHLHTWKGAGTLAQAAQFLPQDFLLLFMGGTDEDIEKFKKEYGADQRIAIIGRKGDEERPLYLRAADVAVLPNTGKDQISASYTSPLKLFGYMAAGTPIVASDLPSIREVLSEKTAFFAQPDDPASFAKVLAHVVIHPTEAQMRAKTARSEVEQYEWQKRSGYILDFLGVTSSS